MKNKSTYSLLINADAEEKGRSIFEVSVYVLVVLCVAVSGWNVASTSVVLPGKVKKPEVQESMIADANAPVAQPPAIAVRG
ncbi:MAG: hypothetical protein ABI946_10425 [Chthoniobacterales bacterium]